MVRSEYLVIGAIVMEVSLEMSRHQDIGDEVGLMQE
jgi:hypothetical protein